MTKKADITKEMSEFGKANINDLLKKSKLTEINMDNTNNKIKELYKMAENIGQITATMSQIASRQIFCL